MAASDANALRAALTSGLVIPAHPLALTAERRLDERRQAALTRYYAEAGAGGIAVGVHSTQFAIRAAGLYEPVLRLAADTVAEARRATGRSIVTIAGAIGPTPQAVAEAETARRLGYDAVLLGLGALREASAAELVAHCRAVASVLPLVGFYLQPAVGGRPLGEAFWCRFLEIEGVVAIKVAPFNRYQTLDVVRALAASGRAADVALYTGNDDAIVLDLLADFPQANATSPVRFVGGLLGQWGVWTRRAVELLDSVKRCRREGGVGALQLLALGQQLTDANAALFDAANAFQRLHPGDSRGPAAPGAPRRTLLPRPAGGPLAGTSRADRPGARQLPSPHGRRLRAREPRAMAPLDDVVSAQKRGLARGIASLCSAHPVVLRAAFEQALLDGVSVLVESTCNQVNQEGGYTGVQPAGFGAFVARLAEETGLPAERVVLGGDHLGPNPWTALGAAPAMDRAREMVRQYVRAGYAKIHLDASMRCADDPPGRSRTRWPRSERPTWRPRPRRPRWSGRRASHSPVYVIGTEVPVPGGQAGGHEGPVATRVVDAERSLDLTRVAFADERTPARLGASAGAGGPARRRVRRRRRVPLPARGRDGPPLVERAPGAARLRGALDGLPVRGRASRPGRGPLRDPQGRPRADVRLPRGGLRAGAGRAGAARAAGERLPLRSAPGARREPCAATRGTGRPTTATPTRRPCACVVPSASAIEPATTGRSRRCRKPSDVCSRTSTRSACPVGLVSQYLPDGVETAEAGPRDGQAARLARLRVRRVLARYSRACGAAGDRVAAGARLPL